MAMESVFDLVPYGVGMEKEILELSYATFAEELQLLEVLKESMDMMASGASTKSEPSSSLSSSSPLLSSTSTPEAISSSGSELSEEGEVLKESMDMLASAITKSEPSSPLSSPAPLLSSTDSTPEAISSSGSELCEEELLETVFNFKSEKETDDPVGEVNKKSECPLCHEFSCTECMALMMSDEGHNQMIFGRGRAEGQSSMLSCFNEQQRVDSDDKGKEHAMARATRRWPRRTPKFYGKWSEEIPQTSSSKNFQGEVSWMAENGFIAGNANRIIQDPKGKGKAIDEDWLLVSRRKAKNRGRNNGVKRWGDLRQRGSKDYSRNLVHHEDEYDSLDNDEDDDFDSDTSQKSHESLKKSKWFKEFFERMAGLNVAEINETCWHCPACQGGPGAIKWYRSIQDLIAHSKKIGTRRLKLHRQLAELLEAELQSKQTSNFASDEPMILGNWKGLSEDAREHEIVWPPMVVIMNTMSSNLKDGKIVGIRIQELLQHFSSYPALKAQHSYGPQGHRGFSVLIFETSALGYLEAERLHKNFIGQGLDRLAWNTCQALVLPGGESQLYGFLAVKEDLDCFNQHFRGKTKIKYEMKSYQEAVLNEIKKMSEDSQQVTWLKNRLEEERRCTKALERTVDNISTNLQQGKRDINIFKKRVQLQHEENQEEMECQENFYKDRINILEARVKELDQKLQESNAYPLHTGEPATTMASQVEEYTPWDQNLNVDESNEVWISSFET